MMQVLTYSSQEQNEDLEDGEIFDDDEEVPAVKPEPPAPPKESIATIVQQLQQQQQQMGGGSGSVKRRRSPLGHGRPKGPSPSRKRPQKRPRDDEKGPGSKKRRKSEENKSEEVEEDEGRARDGSPPGNNNRDFDRYRSDEEDDEGGFNDGPGGGRGMGMRRGRRDFGRSPRGGRRMRGKRMHTPRRDRGSLCKFFLQGNCQRGDDCPFSHMIHSRKWEMCKFYMNDCCVKKDKCNFMHEDFPCKFYHLGLKCYAGKRCKFSHRKVSPFIKQLLIKQNQVESDKHFLQHLQTTGDSRSPTPPDYSDYEGPNSNSNYVTVTLKKRSGGNRDDITVEDIELTSDQEIEQQQSHSHKNHRRENRRANRHSRDSNRDRRGSDRSHNRPTSSHHNRNRETNIPNEDNHRSDEDEARTPMPSPSQNSNDRDEEIDSTSYNPPVSQTHRPKSPEKSPSPPLHDISPATPPPLTIAEEVPPEVNYNDVPLNLPKKQMELYMRIQQQQREAQKIEDDGHTRNKDEEMDEDWYSSDEDGHGGPLATILNRLKTHKTSDAKQTPLPSVRDLPDIDISAVSKLLSSVRETIEKKGSHVSGNIPEPFKEETHKTEEKKRRDPRLTRGGGDSSPPPITTMMGLTSRTMEHALMKLPPLDIDLRVPSKGLGGSHVTGDVDLRQLPFKPVPMHQAAREIDASTSANPPIQWVLKKFPAPPKPEYSHVHPKNPSDPRLKKYLVGGGMSSMPSQMPQMQMPGCGGFGLPPYNQGPMPHHQQLQPPPNMLGNQPQPQQQSNTRDPRQRVLSNDPRRKPNSAPPNMSGHPLVPPQMMQQPQPFPPQQFPNQPPQGFLAPPPGRIGGGPPSGPMGMYPMRGDSDLRNPNGAFHQSDVDLRFQQPAPHPHFP